VGRGILEDVFSIPGQEMVKSTIDLGEEIVIASRQRLGDNFQVRSAGGAEFSFALIIFSTGWTKHREPPLDPRT